MVSSSVGERLRLSEGRAGGKGGGSTGSSGLTGRVIGDTRGDLGRISEDGRVVVGGVGRGGLNEGGGESSLCGNE